MSATVGNMLPKILTNVVPRLKKIKDVVSVTRN